MNLVAYYRVSTARQGQSALGLDAQRAIVQDYARSKNATIVAEVVEVQSGRNDNRPHLQSAIATARNQGAALIVAKLDRLARSASFLDEITRSGIDLLFCNLPDIPPGPTGRFLVQIMAQVAELEAGLISERTRDALKQARARGRILGGYRGGPLPSDDIRKLSADARSAESYRRAIALFPQLDRFKERGPAYIAKAFNAEGIKTLSGRGQWSAAQVTRLQERIESYYREIKNEAERQIIRVAQT